ncbi:MAG: hypothetical protein IPJ74_26760 [Saprospiraceae bacterium]|nr:hypothetical protein [Saprospiraceae bacterium]
MMVSLIDDVQYYNYIAVIAARSYINLITAKLLTDDYHKISKLIDQEIKDRKINIKN